MRLGSKDQSLMSDINVTPFVDVMLVLLIIFMVTAPMMVQGLNVTLPEASSQPFTSEKENLVISIDNNNKIYINDLHVKLDSLQEKLKNILKGSGGKEIYLKADKDISYGMVISVMSEVKMAGFEKIGMITSAPEEQNEKS